MIPAQSHSETSVAAAELIEPHAGSLRAQVLDCIRKFSPLGITDDGIQQALGMNPSTQRPRRIELVAAGLVADSGRTRNTISGRQATIWVAVNKPTQHELL